MYKCIKGFLTEICDGDGFTIENEYMEIEEGSLWHFPEDENYRFIGGEIRLENDEVGWIEITQEHLMEYFEPYNNEKECPHCKSKFTESAMESELCCPHCFKSIEED